MQKVGSIFMLCLTLILAACSSGNDDEATRKTTYYENVTEYWDTFSIQWKSDVCEVISGPEDKEGLEKAIKVMKMMLKLNVGIDGIDITKEDGYSKALRLFLAEKCVG
jgi:hypothetical protein